MKPVGESRSEIEILTDLCERMGKLGGEGGFVAKLNEHLEIAEPYLLPLDKKPTPETILDAWAHSKFEMGLDELQRVGVASKEVPAEELFLNSGEQPFGGVRAHFYLDIFPEIGALMREANVPVDLSERYTAYPTWTTPPIEASPQEYDLYMMDHKRIELKQTRSLELPLLAELAPENPLVMNAAEARRRGLEDGDEVLVESHHPVTGDTRQVRTVLRTSNGIRPDTVSLTHHAARVDQPTVNSLYFYGDGMWDISSGWFSHVKVKVSRAGGGS
jgi:anaerobic selenocysteine-containing dehydrogenase